jgi:hypothetical protein
MFETVTDMIQKQLPAGDYPKWVAPVIALVIAWIIFMMIRGFWCWFWKTTEIVNRLESINHNVNALQVVGNRCKAELSEANSKLERIAESVSAAAGNRQGGPRA